MLEEEVYDTPPDDGPPPRPLETPGQSGREGNPAGEVDLWIYGGVDLCTSEVKIQGYLSEKEPPRRTLQQPYLWQANARLWH